MTDKAKSFLSQIACYLFLVMVFIDFAVRGFILNDKDWQLIIIVLPLYLGGRKFVQGIQQLRGVSPQ